MHEGFIKPRISLLPAVSSNQEHKSHVVWSSFFNLESTIYRMSETNKQKANESCGRWLNWGFERSHQMYSEAPQGQQQAGLDRLLPLLPLPDHLLGCHIQNCRHWKYPRMKLIKNSIMQKKKKKASHEISVCLFFLPFLARGTVHGFELHFLSLSEKGYCQS